MRQIWVVVCLFPMVSSHKIRAGQVGMIIERPMLHGRQGCLDNQVSPDVLRVIGVQGVLSLALWCAFY